MKKLDISKATGLDNISNKILKIAAPCTSLFNLSIKHNVFPNEGKSAKVFPIFKSGERSDSNNYRPISVLLGISTLFERLVYNQIYAYLMKFDLINSRQFGFRSLHSTVTALLDLTNQWYYNIDRGMINGVLFLDLKKLLTLLIIIYY